MIEANKVVRFHYTVKGKDGEVIDTSLDSDPLCYLHGAGNIIPGLEQAMNGMQEGEKKNVEVPAETAYGQFDENLVVEIAKEQFGENVDFMEGMEFQAEIDSIPGTRVYTIREINDESIVADGNHPLAGQDLSFFVEVVSIREATPEEIKLQQPNEL